MTGGWRTGDGYLCAAVWSCPAANFVVCIEIGEYAASLERWKVYRILPDDGARTHDQLRVIDESGEDYLYPAEFFQPIRLPEEREALYTGVSRLKQARGRDRLMSLKQREGGASRSG